MPGTIHPATRGRIKTVTKTTREVKMAFTSKDILEALELAGFIPRGTNAKAFFRVPGGGDWSNAKCDLEDHADAFTVEYKTVEEEGDDE